MKKFPLLILALSSLFILSSSSIKWSKSKIGNHEFVKMYDGNYIDPYEVTVKQYRAFISNLKDSGHTELAIKYAVDSNRWLTAWPKSYNEPLKKVYNNHPKYNDYPVVNISLESMIAYCEWRTEQYNSDANRQFKKVIFQLPHEDEWNQYSAPVLGRPFPWHSEVPYEINRKGKIIPYANLKIMDYGWGDNDYMYDGYLYQAPVNTFKPNSLGLYNMIGNVAEVCRGGVIKGGGFDSTPEESAVNKIQQFELPHPAVGFRLLMKVIEE